MYSARIPGPAEAPIPAPPEQLQADGALAGLIASIGRVLLGKEHQVRLAVAGLLARGHLLLEDLPGTGKTTPAEALARGFGLGFKRVSFTSHQLPADLTGINVLDPGSGTFRFQCGSLFTQVLLADEINRASPRTQSALLEAMAAGRVSIDGTSHDLPSPFVVIATQNGLDQIGTAPLPESQLDQFLMRLSLGFPLYPRASKGLVAAARALSLLEGRPFVTPADVQAVFPSVAEHRLEPSSAGGLSEQLMEQVDALR